MSWSGALLGPLLLNLSIIVVGSWSVLAPGEGGGGGGTCFFSLTPARPPVMGMARMMRDRTDTERDERGSAQGKEEKGRRIPPSALAA